MRSTLALAAALLAAAAVTGWSAQSYELETVQLAAPAVSYAGLEWTPEKPEGVKGLPRFTTGPAMFAYLRVGDTDPRLMAAGYVGEAGDKMPVTVYIDSNGNGSLAGEKAYAIGNVTLVSGMSALATDEIALPARYHMEGQDDILGEFRFRLVCRMGDIDLSALSEGPIGEYPYQLCVEYGHSALVDLGGKQVRLTLVEGSADGKISTEGMYGQDKVIVSEDLAAAPKVGEEPPLGKYLEYGGKYYELQARPDGGEVVIADYTGKPARVTLTGSDGAGQPAEVTRIVAFSESAMLDRKNPGGEIVLLPGKYMFAYVIGEGDPEKHAFTFQSAEETELVGGETLELACGGPVTLTVTAKSGEAEGTDPVVAVDVQAKTAVGHTFSESGREGAPGKVEVLNKAGEVVGSGDAEYG